MKRTNTKPVTKRKITKRSEAAVTRAVREYLDSLGIWHYKNWMGKFSYPLGQSDIIGIYRKLFLAIEVKKSDWVVPNKGTKAYKHHQDQQDFIMNVKRNGGVAFFAQSVEDVVEGLKAVTSGNRE